MHPVLLLGQDAAEPQCAHHNNQLHGLLKERKEAWDYEEERGKMRMKGLARRPHLALLLGDVAVEGLRAHVSAQAGDQLVAVLLGVAEDDGAAERAVAAHQVRRHHRPLAPVARQHQVPHTCRRLCHNNRVLRVSLFLRTTTCNLCTYSRLQITY